MQQETAVNPLDGCHRENVKMWCKVAVVLKKDQKTGFLTEGHVRGILTSKPYHTRGIKVLLDNRQVGRVQQIIDPNPLPYDQRF